MSYIYEPQIEEKDDGYSIPKILVAVLLLILIGAGVYIYYQKKKLNTSVTYLLDSKKQVEKELNEMIEKYNLAIDDNTYLEGDIKDQRDKIIRFRDSIKNLGKDDFGELSNYQKSLSKFRESSAIQFDNPITINSEDSEDLPNKDNEIVEESNTNTSKNTNQKVNTKSTTASKPSAKAKKNISREESLKTENADDNATANNDYSEPVKDIPNDTSVAENKSTPVVNQSTNKVTTSLYKVEVPPTYPGCRGTAAERKKCFSKKVKKHFARKFDASLIEDIGLPKGKYKVWVNFDIDKNGNIINIKTRGPHKKLEQEALKTVKELPKMIAATQNGRNVDVNYTVPIILVSE